MPRWQLGAFVLAMVLVGVFLCTHARTKSNPKPGVISLDRPTPHSIPWSVIGTRDDGRTLIVLPYDKGNICSSWHATLESAPAEVSVRIHVLRKDAACGNEAPDLGTAAAPVAVPLGAPLAGRRVSGGELESIHTKAAAFQTVVRRGRTQVAVPSVAGLTVFDASEIVRAYGFAPVHDAGVSRNATVVAQRPAPTTLRERANPGRVRLITALTSP